MNLPLKIQRQIEEFARICKLEKVVLFGSRARGTNRERSDKMKKHFRYGLFFALGAMLALGFVACGDESSSGPSKNEETGIETEVSSSSEISSHCESCKDEAISSSSAKDEKSSSSKKVESSSSTKAEVSSSSAKNKESSSSGKVEPSSGKDDVSSSSQNVQSSSSGKPVESSSSKAKSSSSEISSSSVKPAESSSSESSSSVKLVESSSSEYSSSSVIETSSSSLVATGVCKTRTEDNCVYGTLYDERDSTTYKTVKIGNQEWMAENLNYKYLGETSQSFCYDGEKENCKKYGRLYQWSAAIDSASLYVDHKMQCGYGRSPCNIPKKWKGVCPKGSHLPTIDEWNSLIDYLGTNRAGKVLKSNNGWVNDYYDGIVENGNGSDEYGFTVLPSGVKESFKYVRENVNAKFWPANDYSERQACKITFSYATETISINLHQEKADAYSVRCIKN